MIVSLIIISILVAVIIVLLNLMKKIVNYGDEKLAEADKYRDFYLLINHWFLLKQKGITIADYLDNKGYSKVIVYGMGALGLRLCDELYKSNVIIERTVDKAYSTIYYKGGEVYGPEKGLKNISADVIIVTTNVTEESIRLYMDNKKIPVIYLKNIIENM